MGRPTDRALRTKLRITIAGLRMPFALPALVSPLDSPALRTGLLGICVTVAGCMAGVRTDVPSPALLPAAWPAPPVAFDDGTVSGDDQAEWGMFYRDPTLQGLVRQALENNRDLRLAMLRVDEARAALGLQSADRWPTLAVGSSHTRARVPGDLNVAGRAVTTGEHRVGLAISNWELDLWGRVRSLEAAAQQAYFASAEGSRAAQAALVNQVARNYLAWRETQERIALTEDTIATRRESLRIFGRRHAAGAISRLALTQVESLLYQAESIGTQLAQQQALQAHALAQLVGVPWDALALAPPQAAVALPTVPAGLPSDLLLRRPDIAAAEHTLHAANARVQAARAAFFPRIALTTSAGTASAHLDGLFDSGSRAWTFAPSISLPLFDGGRLQSNLDLSAARQNIAVADYEKTVQTAFREVSDALATRATAARQITLQQAQRDALHERARLAQLRYDHGATPYFEVLDAQRDLLAAEQQLVQARYALQAAHIAVYAALGGGAPAR